MANPQQPPLTLDTQFLLAKLDLHTEKLLAESEAIVIANANREAAQATLDALQERGAPYSI